MQTGSKVLDKDGSLLGIILEKLNGQGVVDRFDDLKFSDVDYILEMVKQVGVSIKRVFALTVVEVSYSRSTCWSS